MGSQKIKNHGNRPREGCSKTDTNRDLPPILIQINVWVLRVTNIRVSKTIISCTCCCYLETEKHNPPNFTHRILDWNRRQIAVGICFWATFSPAVSVISDVLRCRFLTMFLIEITITIWIFHAPKNVLKNGQKKSKIRWVKFGGLCFSVSKIIIWCFAWTTTTTTVQIIKQVVRDRKTQPTEFYPPKFGLFLSVFKHIFQSMKNPDCNGDFDQKHRQKMTP